MMPKARSMEEKPDKLAVIQVTLFYSVKDTLKRMKGRVVQDWEKMYVNYKSDRVYVTRGLCFDCDSKNPTRKRHF